MNHGTSVRLGDAVSVALLGIAIGLSRYKK